MGSDRAGTGMTGMVVVVVVEDGEGMVARGGAGAEPPCPGGKGARNGELGLNSGIGKGRIGRDIWSVFLCIRYGSDL